MSNEQLRIGSLLNQISARTDVTPKQKATLKTLCHNIVNSQKEKDELLEELGLTRSQTKKPSTWGQDSNRNSM